MRPKPHDAQSSIRRSKLERQPTTVKIKRESDGTWWNAKGNQCFVGEDAAILDKLFGIGENDE